MTWPVFPGVWLDIDNSITQLYCCVMVPSFTSTGNLPPGIHWVSWDELCERFGYNPHRTWLIKGLEIALRELAKAGCKTVYVDGSFVTAKEIPGDYDGCWSIVDVDKPEQLDPILLHQRGREAMQEKYRGDLFPAELPEGVSGRLFLDFFQMDKATGEPKGIVALDIRAML